MSESMPWPARHALRSRPLKKFPWIYLASIYAPHAKEIRGQEVDNGLGKKDAGQGDQAEQDSDKDQHIGCQLPGGLSVLIAVIIGKNGYKGGGKRSLGEQVAQQIGDAKGNHKSVIGITRTKHAGEYLLPHQTEDAAAHDRTADRACGPSYFTR